MYKPIYIFQRKYNEWIISPTKPTGIKPYVIVPGWNEDAFDEARRTLQSIKYSEDHEIIYDLSLLPGSGLVIKNDSCETIIYGTYNNQKKEK